MWYFALLLCLFIVYLTARIINHYGDHAANAIAFANSTSSTSSTSHTSPMPSELREDNFESDIAPANLGEPPTYGSLFVPIDDELRHTMFASGDVRYDPQM